MVLLLKEAVLTAERALLYALGFQFRHALRCTNVCEMKHQQRPHADLFLIMCYTYIKICVSSTT